MFLKSSPRCAPGPLRVMNVIFGFARYVVFAPARCRGSRHRHWLTSANSCREQNVRHKHFHCYEKPKWYADYILSECRATLALNCLLFGIIFFWHAKSEAHLLEIDSCSDDDLA